MICQTIIHILLLRVLVVIFFMTSVATRSKNVLIHINTEQYIVISKIIYR